MVNFDEDEYDKICKKLKRYFANMPLTVTSEAMVAGRHFHTIRGQKTSLGVDISRNKRDFQEKVIFRIDPFDMQFYVNLFLQKETAIG